MCNCGSICVLCVHICRWARLDVASVPLGDPSNCTTRGPEFRSTAWPYTDMTREGDSIARPLAW